ncbi:hypothetical protein ABZ372_28360, partial [Streptomyces sp. NPDC005921]
AGSRSVDELIAAAKEWHAEERFEGVFTFSESGVLPVFTATFSWVTTKRYNFDPSNGSCLKIGYK